MVLLLLSNPWKPILTINKIRFLVSIILEVYHSSVSDDRDDTALLATESPYTNLSAMAVPIALF